MISAKDIAAAVGTTPTNEQIKIIESPLEPAVVIAGAGSGKTETMAARVLHLVANGYAKPEEILGLTFTRKAAGELKNRIRRRLKELRAQKIIPANLSIDVPVMTYHSYAGNIIREYGLRLGLDNDLELVGEAVAWQQAAKILRSWPDENFTYEGAFSTLVKDLLGYTKNVLEHGVENSQVIEISENILDRLNAIESDKDVEKAKLVLQQRIKLAELSTALLNERRRTGQLTFDDQMFYAAKIATDLPEVGQMERIKYKAVLLDEYQDTSQSQVRMLSALFGDHPVTAVGDPYQAIYGWRGAAIGTIKSFNGKKSYSLSTTFRNDEAILEVANRFGQVIGKQINQEVLPLKARNGAGPGEVISDIYENVELEGMGIAARFKRIFQEANGSESFAVLVRNRKQIPIIESALRAEGLPVEVLGIGGLMQVPEVQDVYTLLKVLVDVDAGAALMRHLVGPRIALGAEDIAALGRYKKLLDSTAGSSRKLVAQLTTEVMQSAESEDGAIGSLIEALDEIEGADRSEFSSIGFKRLLEFSKDLRHLRSRANVSLSDLIFEIEEYLGLSIELLMRDGGQSGRRHLDRFNEEAAKFSQSNGSINDFIRWLEATIEYERGLEAGAPEVRKDAIQILTIHMSKGAEWDHVAIPGIVDGQFPQTNQRDSISWLHNEAELPFELRGDSSEFPAFDTSKLKDKKSAAAEIKDFKGRSAQVREREEWRLAYVAVTRAKKSLHCTMSYWDDRKNIDEASDIFKLICTDWNRDISDIPTSNPLLEVIRSRQWPIGNPRLAELQQAIDIYERIDADISYDADAALLVKQAELRRLDKNIYLPPRLSVSMLIALRDNPAALAEAIRRPMPFLQDQFARRGTEFHNWIEKHLKCETLFDDDDLDYVDPIEKDQKLDELKSKWLNSHWATKTPVDLEVPFETTLAGVLIRGRIDAVYKTESGYEVVDWKTGSKVLSESAAIQLAMYRLAWAKISKVDVSTVSAAFHYVPTGIDDRRSDLMSEQELVALLEKQ